MDKKTEIIECLFNGWLDSDRMGLYGNISYQDVIDLMIELKINPDKLIDKLQKFEERANELLKDIS